MNRFWCRLIASVFITSLVGLSGCKREHEYMMQGIIWNTEYHIKYFASEDLSDSILSQLKRVEESVSIFTPNSLVNHVNDADSVEIDEIFKEIYVTSLRINEESGGYFDPTLAPLIEAYGFAGKEGKLPDKRATDSIMQFVGIGKTHMDGNRLLKADPRLKFNFSAIAKGYACDMVGNYLSKHGDGNYLVEIGGEVKAGGVNPKGGKWRIQVDKPVFSSDSVVHEAQVVIGISNCGVATSGNYRNYRQTEGKRIGHTFDPHTGEPALNDMLSATIVSSTCMEADAYATACMAMGFEKAKEMVEKQKLSALLISSEGNIWMSEEFRKLIITD